MRTYSAALIEIRVPSCVFRAPVSISVTSPPVYEAKVVCVPSEHYWLCEEATRGGLGMSFTKKDRRIRSISGITFPSGSFAGAIAAALHREYGATHAAVKTVVGLTGANERAVKN